MTAERRHRRIRNTVIILLALSAVVGLLAYNIYSSYHNLIVREWTISSDKIEQDVDLVVVSDLHTSTFGEKNEELVSMIADQNPDAIILAGDMLNSDAADDTEVCSLVRQLVGIAPVYYGLGNHEIDYMEAAADGDDDSSQYGEDSSEYEEDSSGDNSSIYFHMDSADPLIQDLEAAGAIMLDETYTDITINGNAIRIGGLYNYAFTREGAVSLLDEAKVYSFLSDFQNTDAFQLMISHRPDSFVFGDASKLWNIDLVISGHDHGGQVIIGNVGLYGGDQGFFPEYVHGLFTKDNLQIFITSGLGSQSELLPRFNNRPEIAVLHLTAAE